MPFYSDGDLTGRIWNMKCDDYRLLMMDDLYDEISSEDKERLNDHLKTCTGCREKYRTLRATAGRLKQWEDIEPHMKLTFVHQPASRFADFFQSLKAWKLPTRLAVCAAAGLFLLSLFNTRIQYANGQFSFQASLFKSGPEIPAAQLATKTDLDDLRRENYQMVATILDEYAKRNKIETAVMFEKFYDELEKQRKNDLYVLSNAVEQIQTGTSRRLEQTDRTLGSLIQYVNLQNRGR